LIKAELLALREQKAGSELADKDLIYEPELFQQKHDGAELNADELFK
jgi:hypothetical protein